MMQIHDQDFSVNIIKKQNKKTEHFSLVYSYECLIHDWGPEIITG